MKRIIKLFSGVLGLLSLVVLIIILSIAFRNLKEESSLSSSSLFQSPIRTPTWPPYPPPITPSGPPATPTLAPEQIPICIFPARMAPAELATSLDTYKLSQPQVVLTHTSAIEIADWLPNNQQLLITKDIPGTNRQVIELFDTQTGKESVYAERHSINTPPVWLSAYKSVAFIDSTMEEGWALRLSHSPGESVEALQTHLASPYLAANSTGDKVSFLLWGQSARPAVFDLREKKIQPFDIQLPFAPRRKSLDAPLAPEEFYRVAWEPRGTRIAFYNQTGLYLLDLTTGQACRMELGLAGIGKRASRWAYLAKWSPNGRYLAMITTSGRLPLEFSELTLLDTMTGDLHTIQPKRYLPSGKYYVLDIDWAPDSTTIAERVAIAIKEGVAYDGVYLVSSRDNRQKRQLSELTFAGASAGVSLSWSPAGEYLILNCPTSNEGRLCQITVTK